jgi:hypothetical protein
MNMHTNLIIKQDIFDCQHYSSNCISEGILQRTSEFSVHGGSYQKNRVTGVIVLSWAVGPSCLWRHGSYLSVSLTISLNLPCLLVGRGFSIVTTHLSICDSVLVYQWIYRRMCATTDDPWPLTRMCPLLHFPNFQVAFPSCRPLHARAQRARRLGPCIAG